MDLKRCAMGHFYDGEKFQSCPHCESVRGGNPNETVSYDQPNGKDPVTVSIGGKPPQSAPPPPPPPPPPQPPQPVDDPKTVGYFGNFHQVPGVEIVEPVVGWLVCTAGKRCGKDYRLKAGRNFIGRGPQMNIMLEDETSVSREAHAIVAYEPRQNIFIAQPGSGAELFYVNDNVVLSAVQIKRNDRLQIGNVELMLIPCCDEVFKWEKKPQAEENK